MLKFQFQQSTKQLSVATSFVNYHWVRWDYFCQADIVQSDRMPNSIDTCQIVPMPIFVLLIDAFEKFHFSAKKYGEFVGKLGVVKCMHANVSSVWIYRFCFVWMIRPNLQNLTNWKLITKHLQLFWIQFINTLFLPPKHFTHIPCI